jgi:hypothetical protein
MIEPLHTLKFPLKEVVTQKNVKGNCLLHLHTDYAERFLNITSDVATTDDDNKMILEWEYEKISYEKSAFDRKMIAGIQVTRTVSGIDDSVYYKIYIDVYGIAESLTFRLDDKKTALEYYEYLLKWWRTGEV